MSRRRASWAREVTAWGSSRREVLEVPAGCRGLRVAKTHGSRPRVAAAPPLTRARPVSHPEVHAETLNPLSAGAGLLPSSPSPVLSLPSPLSPLLPFLLCLPFLPRAAPSLLLSSPRAPGLPPPTLAFVCQIRGVLRLELPAVPTLPLGPLRFLLAPCLAARGQQELFAPSLRSSFCSVSPV